MMSSNHTSTALSTPGALLSGVLLALAFPCHPDNPLAPLYSGLWAWIALAPLLVVLATATSRRRAFRLGASTGFLFHLLSLYWIGNTQGGAPPSSPVPFWAPPG